MSKRRKTREQKIVADNRHLHYHLDPQYSLNPSKTLSEQPHIPTTALANNFSYLKKDLTKTAFITGLIIALQSLIFIFLKNNSLSFLGIKY